MLQKKCDRCKKEVENFAWTWQELSRNLGIIRALALVELCDICYESFKEWLANNQGSFGRPDIPISGNTVNQKIGNEIKKQ